jgi:hypothetical protein
MVLKDPNHGGQLLVYVVATIALVLVFCIYAFSAAS